MGEPRCAACHISIRGRTFKIRDELAFHDGCVNLPAILERDLKAANDELAREQAARKQAIADRKAIRGDVEKELQNILHNLNTHKLARDASEQTAQYLTSELRTAHARIAALEAELAARPAPAKEIPQNDTRDASSIRFELLELK